MVINNKTTEKVTTIDSQTGEVLDQTISTHNVQINRKVTRENFIMVYLEDMSGLLKIENGTQANLLHIIWNEVSFNNPEVNEGNTIAILKDVKERWCKQLGCEIRTIENALAALVKKDLLQKICKGRYRLNPCYFFKGSSTDRQKVINIRTTYEIEPEKE